MAERGQAMGRHRVRTLMRLNGLRHVWRRRFVHTTHSKHTMAVSSNVLNRQFTQALPNQVWVCDITYIRTRSGWLYLAAVLDLHSRKIVGWAMAHEMPAAWCAEPCKWLSSSAILLRSRCAFRQGYPVRQRGVSSAFDKVWPDWQHEP